MKVTLNVCVPPVKAAPPGIVALPSVEVNPTVSLAVLTRFQFASTALTVTLKGVPAARAVGAPVFPLTVPGAAVSPGTNNCSLANAPAFTVTRELVLAVFVPSVTSVAIIVLLPAVLSVTENVLVPLDSPAFAGNVAPVSEDVILTVSVALVTRFQFASTALTETLNELPAVCARLLPVLPVAVPGAALSPGTNT